jgi:hypothetical protein
MTAPPTEPTIAPIEREADTAVLGQMAAGLDQPRRGKRADRDKERAARAEEQARVRQEKQEAKRAARQEKAELKAQRKQQEREAREAALAARAELEEEPVGGEPVQDEPSAAPLVVDEPDGSSNDDGDDDGARFAPAELLVARLPEVKSVYAAIISGLLAGLAAVLLAIGASKGCEAVRDNSSCGGGAGLLAIVAILAIEVAVGANLLKAWQISDPFSTSFLGVGVVATIAMLVFLDDLNSPWMLLVIPLMTAVAFALSWWVTVKFIDEHPMTSEIDSERGEPAFHEHPSDQGEDSNA